MMMDSHMSLLFLGGPTPPSTIPSHISSVSLPGRLHASSASTTTASVQEEAGEGASHNNQNNHKHAKDHRSSQHRRSSDDDSALTELTSSGSSISGAASSWLSRWGLLAETTATTTPQQELGESSTNNITDTVEQEHQSSTSAGLSSPRIPPSAAFPVQWHHMPIGEQQDSSSSLEAQQYATAQEEKQNSLSKHQQSASDLTAPSHPLTRPRSSSFRTKDKPLSSSRHRPRVSFDLAHTQIHESAIPEALYSEILAELQHQHPSYLDATMVHEYIQQLTWYDSDTLEHWQMSHNLHARALLIMSNNSNKSTRSTTANCWEPLQVMYQQVYRIAGEYYEQYQKEAHERTLQQHQQTSNNDAEISHGDSLCWTKAYLYSSNIITTDEWESLRANLRHVYHTHTGLWGLEHVGLSTICRQRTAVAMTRGHLAAILKTSTTTTTSITSSDNRNARQIMVERGACQLLVREMAEAQAGVLYEEEKRLEVDTKAMKTVEN